jgi:hypothetical protein
MQIITQSIKITLLSIVWYSINAHAMRLHQFDPWLVSDGDTVLPVWDHPLSRRGHSTSLHAAAQAGDNHGVRIALASGIDVNVRDNVGISALVRAVWADSPEVVETLLNAKAQVNDNTDKFTALYYAANKGKGSIVKLLLDAGAEVNVPEEMTSPLQSAFYFYDSPDDSLIWLSDKRPRDFPTTIGRLILAGTDVNHRGEGPRDLRLTADVIRTLAPEIQDVVREAIRVKKELDVTDRAQPHAIEMISRLLLSPLAGIVMEYYVPVSHNKHVQQLIEEHLRCHVGREFS